MTIHWLAVAVAEEAPSCRGYEEAGSGVQPALVRWYHELALPDRPPTTNLEEGQRNFVVIFMILAIFIVAFSLFNGLLVPSHLRSHTR